MRYLRVSANNGTVKALERWAKRPPSESSGIIDGRAEIVFLLIAVKNERVTGLPLTGELHFGPQAKSKDLNFM